MSDTITPPRPRKPRGPGRLSPQHLDYLRYRQSGKTQKEAAHLAHVSIAKAKRAEKHPDGQRYLAEVAENARIEGHYGLVEAVKEVDKAIGFAYEKENPNAIAKLLEHKSKLYGLLVEKIDVKATYIDLKGALEQAKERVLVQLNSGDRGISAPAISAPSPGSLPVIPASTTTNTLNSDSPGTAPTASTSIDSTEAAICLRQNSLSITEAMQAETVEAEGNQQVIETSSDNHVYVNSENPVESPEKSGQ